MLFISDDYTEGWVDALRMIDENMPYRKECFYNALGQFEMTKHNEIKLAFESIGAAPQSVNVLASGIALFLPTYLHEQGVDNIRLYDYDRQAVELNWRINKHIPNLKQEALDVIFDIEWIDKDVDLVINQSCENMWHMKTTLNKYKPGTFFIFQSTFVPAKGRINVPSSLDQFIKSTGLSAHNVLYKKASKGMFTVMGNTNV
jgi:hypothetical protein